MEDRMTFGDLITSEYINDDTHVIIHDYTTTKAGRWFEDAILAYNNRAVYAFQVLPAENKIVVELAGEWNMPDYYKPKYVVMVNLAPRCTEDLIDDHGPFEYSGTIHADQSAARRELEEALNDSGIDRAWVKEI